MLVVLGCWACSTAIVIGILYATQQRTDPRSTSMRWATAVTARGTWPCPTRTPGFRVGLHRLLGLAAGSGVFGLYGLAYSTLAWR